MPAVSRLWWRFVPILPNHRNIISLWGRKGYYCICQLLKKKKKKLSPEIFESFLTEKVQNQLTDKGERMPEHRTFHFLQSTYKARLSRCTCSAAKPKWIFDFVLVVGGGGGGSIMHSSERDLPSDSSVVKNMKKKRDDNLYVTQFRGELNCVTSRWHEFRIF